jgi:phosphinothricin acetyltransferase
MALSVTLRSMVAGDWAQVRAIYAEGMATGQATFETSLPDWENWDANHLAVCRLVAGAGELVAGWAALSPVSRRPVYAGLAEISIYVGSAFQGQGVGRVLLEELIRQSEQAGLWTLQATIFAENSASQALHAACGFRVVGRRERIAQRAGTWHDTILMERRSPRIG